MHILITGGGCEEPIDGVRSIGNFSSGKTAAFLCDHFVSRNFSVTAVFSQRAVKPKKNVILYNYSTFQELASILQQVLAQYSFDMIIHAAAVSDFSPDLVTLNGIGYSPGSIGKIESGSDVVIHLKENPKLIDSLTSWSRNKACKIIGFKLTNGAPFNIREELSLALLKRTGIDFVVANDLSEITGDQHPVRIYRRKSGDDLECRGQGQTKQELADMLTSIALGVQGETAYDSDNRCR